MEDSAMSRFLSKLVVAIFVIALVDLLYLNWWAIRSQKSPLRQGFGGQADESRSIEVKPSEEPLAKSSPTPNASSDGKAAETKTVETKTVVERETQTIVQTAQKEIFIPIGSGSTKNNNYTNLSGLEVTIDTNKYSAIESVVFEASIWVQDGNGKVNAQLYNKSDGHPVWNSEITTNAAAGILKTSDKITLTKGSITYLVQAKTDLVEYAAHVDNARIKIILK